MNPVMRQVEYEVRRIPKVPMRKGKWTAEEEIYANCIIELFNEGMLPIIAGTTLRSFLSQKLNWLVLTLSQRCNIH